MVKNDKYQNVKMPKCHNGKMPKCQNYKNVKKWTSQKVKQVSATCGKPPLWVTSPRPRVIPQWFATVSSPIKRHWAEDLGHQAPEFNKWGWSIVPLVRECSFVLSFLVQTALKGHTSEGHVNGIKIPWLAGSRGKRRAKSISCKREKPPWLSVAYSPKRVYARRLTVRKTPK